jgi:predicted transcriptional regulator
MSDTDRAKLDTPTLLELTARIVSAYAGNATLSATQLTEVIGVVSRALSDVGNAPAAAAVEAQMPAVPIKKSVTPDFIVCLEDGKKLKMLKRHLMSTYGLTPADYRTKWGLPRDYPMVAPNYAATRSQLAKKIGLGRTPAPVAPPAPVKAARAAKPADAQPTAAKPAATRGRPRKVAAA